MDSPRRSNIVLIGFRGVGKSSVGRALAALLEWQCVDTDAEIEAAAGRTIRDIFATDGEAAFRQHEHDILSQVTANERQIISVGGGAVLRADNRALLHEAGLCVWLTAPVATLQARIEADPSSAATRPALSSAGVIQEVATVLAEREPLYAALADHVLDTSQHSIDDAAAQIAAYHASFRG